jgi:ribosomal protein S18 acetylase RimI-like enzyme
VLPPSAPPALALPAAFASQGLSLRPARTADLAFERALFETARTDAALIAAWPEDARRPFLDQQFQAQTVHYARAYPRADRLIVLMQRTAAGRLILDRTGPEWVLVDIALMPGWRGQGLGRALLGSILQAAAEAKAPVLLSVEVNNRARALYERLGFVAGEETFPSVSMQWAPQGQLKTA